MLCKTLVTCSAATSHEVHFCGGRIRKLLYMVNDSSYFGARGISVEIFIFRAGGIYVSSFTFFIW